VQRLKHFSSEEIPNVIVNKKNQNIRVFFTGVKSRKVNTFKRRWCAWALVTSSHMSASYMGYLQIYCSAHNVHLHYNYFLLIMRTCFRSVQKLQYLIKAFVINHSYIICTHILHQWKLSICMRVSSAYILHVISSILWETCKRDGMDSGWSTSQSLNHCWCTSFFLRRGLHCNSVKRP